ncbi:hypothetical protein AAFF_G00053590 [Aldrovandia affinis]|uniref:RRM domain-containing protein n=1 Tax=Aldrovandia affinis TaxID=143900 RepID=A0AAD7S134_9TELE|nr:hypothetical protein AAFF_G00053590 [Aldrovandia affinis]
MADCASLLDEELSSFVFNYLTEKSGSQYGEEEVSSDRLDADFPDIDLSQLDASDFDSVNCLSELHWCNDQSDTSPASIQYSTGDPELFEIEEENAALLAALTDSLDGMVEDEVGGLSVFPSLGEGPEEEDLPLGNEPFPLSLGPETEDPSLLKKLLLSPPNVPAGIETHKEGSAHRHSNRTQHLKPARPLVKCDSAVRPRAVRPVGRLCTELHRHLTTTQEAEDTPSGDTEDDSESEEEEDEDEEEEEEGGESGSEEDEEGAGPAERGEPQFSSERELRSVVELIKYMHTYCLPARKQSAGGGGGGGGGGARPRAAFTRRHEAQGHSLLRELLETVDSFDVSKPYRLHSPPYSRRSGADRGAELSNPAPRPGKPELKDSGSRGPRAPAEPDGPGRAKEPEPGDSSFSVRRSRRLASFPGRFGRKGRAGRARAGSVPEHGGAEPETLRHHGAEKAGHNSTACKSNGQKAAAATDRHCVKRACLCLPLAPKSTGDAQFASKAFEQTLSVELCGTAGLTPPTTPPHKPAEDELFKPEGKGGTELYAQLRRMGQTGEGPEKGVAHRAFGDHDYCLQGLGESRKRPAPGGRGVEDSVKEEEEQQEEQQEEEEEEEEEEEDSGVWSWAGSRLTEEKLFSKLPEYLRRQESKMEERRSASPQALSPRNAEEGTERSPRPPTPNHHVPCTSCCLPRSPSGKLTFSCENSGACHGDKLRSKSNEDCRVFYIHNLPGGVTQSMLRRRFEAFGEPEDCKIIVKNDERCGVITFLRPPSGQGQRRRRDPPTQNAGSSPRRFCRKRYIDLDEGPGPVKSKYDALDFDTLLKEAQRSLHR